MILLMHDKIIMMKNNQRSALLVMDVQTGIVNNFAKDAKLIPTIKSAIAVARKKKLPVIYVKVAFRDDFPEISKNNKSFSMIQKRSALFADKKTIDIYPEVAPKSGDIVVEKRRVSAFAG